MPKPPAPVYGGFGFGYSGFGSIGSVASTYAPAPFGSIFGGYSSAYIPPPIFPKKVEKKP